MTRKSYHEEQKSNSLFGFIFQNAKTILICLIVAFTLRSLVYEPYNIPSGSMMPNLLIGDYVFVSKSAYGYSRYSFPFSLPIFKGRKYDEKPKRGDIVVFRPPHQLGDNFVKRLVGMPGDTLQMKQSALYINGQKLPRKEAGQYKEVLDDGRIIVIDQFIETLPNGVSYKILDATRNGDLDNTVQYKVPEGHYFFMGDNRDNSADSRVLNKMGYVPYENIVGQADIIVFSNTARIWEVWKWFTSFRSKRFWVEAK